MTSRLTAVVLLASGLVLACSDGVAPPADVQGPSVQPLQRTMIPAAEFKPLGWNGAEPGPVFSGFATAADGTVLPPARDLPGLEILASPGVGTLPLVTFQVSFWAVKGAERSVQIDYQSSACKVSEPCPYLRFTVPKRGLKRLPNGSEIQWGDSVLITVSVDSTQILARMEPTGLWFDEDYPPLLEMWYSGTSHDFNGDGVVDDEDAYIQRYKLALFSQQQVYDPWLILSSYHDVWGERFGARLGHFTGFSVSY